MLKKKPEILVEDNKFCPGCGHGIINRLVAEVLEEMNLEKDAIGAVAVGCACLMIDTFGVDWIQAQHGRAAAVASGIKRCRPNKPVFTYQGDGDALAIGFSETMYAAIRNENITVIFVNNGVFGMTGGQMAPTTLDRQKTTTSPKGRDVGVTGKPVNVINLMKNLDVAYLARGSVINPSEISKTKKYIRSAFETQISGEGYSFVEVISPCPTNWGLTPIDSLERIKSEVLDIYPTGEYVKRGGK
ncbi:thiamine pyrophosphate-dependent enzyme [Tepidibacter aestuarii]|uniref:thiamine pyrophosphate-dependent enzyme n=1 Tax=Tepidibacter aestuarii TaxID=2925782 RepID=UPI0020C082CD|nr:thiamine pyrophosphate-dependent enzyme [Tepidibacter aestuarii]CAH2213802.1 2-oxoglutarate oxidoreductase [Tepidibacter aestuarii]